MVEITSPFFSLEGQAQRLKNVVDTFGAIGSNLIQGKILTGVPVAKKFEGTIVEPVAKAITTPAFIAAAPAVAATGIVYGGAIATGVKTAVAGVSAGVGTAIKKATGAAKEVAAVKTAISPIAPKVIVSNPPAPVEIQQKLPQVMVKASAPPPAPKQEAISQPIAAAPELPVISMATDTTNFLKTADAFTGLPENSIVNTGAAAVSNARTTAKAPKKARKASKKAKKKTKKSSSRVRSPKKRGTRASFKSSKQVHYTKNDQPYIITASGKARFIKKSSGLNRRKRVGGYY